MGGLLLQDRREAGRLLARRLEPYAGQDGIVYALPRGGVVLGAEVAAFLKMPLDLLIPRKVGYPGNPEYAVCAVTEDGHLVCNETVAGTLDPGWLKAEVEREMKEARRRREAYMGGRELLEAEGRTAIIVDDGIATGLTMRAAILQVRERNPARIVVAVPVIPPDTAAWLKAEVEEVVALEIPDAYFGAVSAYYRDFPPVRDEEVIALLRQADQNTA